MPRMTSHELQVVLESRMTQLGMKITGDAKWKIVNLSKGLPAYAHSLGRGATLAALDSRKLIVNEFHVDYAIDGFLKSSQNTLLVKYESATKSNQAKARFKQILTACALANTESEGGYFTAKQVQEPLSRILHKTLGIDAFNPNLKEFSSEKRGSVLQQTGAERGYRYRFTDPAMQPYVIMKGIQENFLDEKAKSALSAPEQRSLFPIDL